MMRKFVVGIVGVLVLALAAPAWACEAPPQEMGQRCFRSAVGGGPRDSVVDVTAITTDEFFGARLVVVRHKRVPTHHFAFADYAKLQKTVLSVIVPEGTTVYSFAVPHRFRNGAIYEAFIQDADRRLGGCDTVAVDVENLLLRGAA
jgi:hypothetical protein